MKSVKVGVIGLCVAMALSGMAQSDAFAPVKDAIRLANAEALSRQFNTSVDVTLDGPVTTYSRAQAKLVFQKFFDQNPVAEFAVVHTGSSKGGLQFALGRYVSGSQRYNVIIRAREQQSSFLVHEISFTKEEK
ncbi:MAG: DUF4783 domain-containing protein [Cyclobacteriaceae bacterium]|jgi:hypothetical protein|nr:DUF4783 domain-containing protein [Cyclobacteriaceae bacterium]